MKYIGLTFKHGFGAWLVTPWTYTAYVYNRHVRMHCLIVGSRQRPWHWSKFQDMPGRWGRAAEVGEPINQGVTQ